MEQTIREIIMQADDERNLDLIRWVKDILNEFSSTCMPTRLAVHRGKTYK